MHDIDLSKGRAAMAYVGETPWHGLGRALSPGADIETWRTEAGLDYRVERSAVLFERPTPERPVNPTEFTPDLMQVFPDTQVLYRGDTGAPLSVVSGRYQIVQPDEVLGFFAKLAQIGGFQMETAGVLSKGRRIWALARVNEGAPIIGQDMVRPYVLLATSYDGTLATTAKMTAIRVVCNNTLSMAAGGNPLKGENKIEADTEVGVVSSMIRIPHTQKFSADAVRLQLGIVRDSWERFRLQMALLAQMPIDEAKADEFVFKLLKPAGEPKPDAPDVRSSKAYKSIMQMFDGGLIGAELTGGQNAWSLLNCVTEWVDHHRGLTDDSRMNAAWFGEGDRLKSRARDVLVKATQEAFA